MKQNNFLRFKLLMLFSFALFNITSITAQTTEVFETETDNSTSFTDNGVTFNITTTGDTYEIKNNTGNGYNGSSTDNKYINNDGSADAQSMGGTAGTDFIIKTSDGSEFFIHQFYLLASNINGEAPTGGGGGGGGGAPSELYFIGKKNGVEVFNLTKDSGIEDPQFGANNGYTLIDFVNGFAANHSTTEIDELSIQGGSEYDVLRLDAFKWQKIATANTFTPSSGNWNTAGNWSAGNVPLATDDVNIPTGKTVNINITTAVSKNLTVVGTLNINTGQALTINGNLTQSGTFTINSDATTNGSLMITGTSTGNVTYKRFLTTSGVASEGWHLVTSPVNGQGINAMVGSFLTSGTKYSIAPYKNTVATALRWDYYTSDVVNPITGAGNYIKAKGYSIKKATAGTLDFTGTLYTDNETIALTDGGDDPAGNRWNLIGNTYTASLHGNNAAHATNNFLKVNNDTGNLDPARGGLYLWNGTSYDVKAVDDAAFYIAPGQAFFVHSKDGGGSSASFTEAMQTHQTGNIFLRNSTNYPEIILNISDNTNNSSTKIRYIDDKTTDLDPGSDVGTFTGVNSNFEVFSHLVSNSQGINFAIQALPNSDFENMIVPVGLKAAANTEISFSVNVRNLPTDLKVFLEDKNTNTFTRLDITNSSYKITNDNSINGIGRFYLHTSKNALSNKDISLENVNVYKTNPSNIRIVGIQKGKTTVNLFTVHGKKVLSTSFQQVEIKDISLPKLTSGIYILKLENEAGILSKKIILE